MNYQSILEHIYREIQPFAQLGKQADYIPALAQVDPDQFGICLHLLSGETYELGQSDVRFSIQSITKVFALAVALSLEGEDLWRRMGVEPSGTAFNSLVQLEYEKGIPRNPFINAGAIVMADILMSHMGLEESERFYLHFLRTLADSEEVDYNPQVAASEQSCGYMNAAIANLLKYHGNLRNEVNDVLHLYFMMCSVEMNCREMSHAFLAFANSSNPFSYAGVELTASRVKRINAVMQTCGFYDEAGEFSFLVGLPGKSGVGGGVAAVCPSRYAITVWSPRLNAKGNSIMAMKALELFTTETSESIF